MPFTRRNSSVWLVTALLLGGAATFLLALNSPVGFQISAIGLAILWAAFLPTLVYFYTPRSSAVPFFPAVGAFYAFFFGLPIFLISLRWPDSNSITMYSRANLAEIRPAVLLLILGGVCVMICTFYLAKKLLKPGLPAFSLSHTTSGVTLKFLYWPLVIGHLTYLYTPSLHSIPSLGQFLMPVGLLGFAGLYLEWRRRRVSSREALCTLGLFMTLKLYSVIKLLFLTELVLLAVFILFVLWREKQFTLITLPVVAVLSALLLYGASTSIKQIAPPGLERLSVVASEWVRLNSTGQSRLKPGTTDGLDGLQARFGSLVHRISHIWVFHIVADQVPDQVPYWKGESYRPLLTSIVPRAIYGSKPREELGGEFGRRFGLLAPLERQKSTSVNVPWLTELLANFGTWGVIWGMAFFGIFLAFLDRVFNSSNATDLDFVFGLTLIFPLVYPESNFSVMTGSLIPLFISLYVYFRGGAWLLGKFHKGGSP